MSKSVGVINVQRKLLKEISINSMDDIELFLSGLNSAMLNRSKENKRIPYKAMSVNDIEKEQAHGDSFFALKNEADQVIGGGAIRWNYSGNKNYSELRHIWIAVEMQGRGFGTSLLYALEEKVKSGGGTVMFLSVASIYSPALRLYEKMGFRWQEIYANVPNTYYFIKLVKHLKSPSSDIRRVISLTWSWIKFNILFYKDSSPRLLHKMIYG